MTAHIVVIGSLNMDLVVQSPRHPNPGETLIGTSFHTLPGGKGANQAVAAARIGAAVTMIGCVGLDSFGDQLIETLHAASVDTTCIQRVAESTGVALITVSEAGANTIVVVPGANATVSPAQVRAHEDIIRRADAVLLQLEIPLPAVKAAAELAHAHGVPVILNPAPAQPLGRDVLQHVSYLIPNEHEAALLTGATGISGDMGEAARALQAAGVDSVVVTLGENGALLVDGSTTHTTPAFPVDAVDSTAAGDAFVGAFAVALSEGRPPADAVVWGCAAGAWACTVLGAQRSLPERQRVAKLVAGRTETN